MPELADRLQGEHGVSVDPSALSRLLCQASWTYKKALAAQQVERVDVAKRRRRWFRWLLPWLSRRLAHVFIDETAVTTKMTRLRGRAQQGQRLRAPTPYAKGGTQTFIAGLRRDGGWTAPRFDRTPTLTGGPGYRPGTMLMSDMVLLCPLKDKLYQYNGWFTCI